MIRLIIILLVFTSCMHKVKIVEYYEGETKTKLAEYYVLKEDNNVLDGKYRAFHENGNVQEKATYKKNEIVGKRYLYYPNEQLKIVENHKNGVFQGKYISYYETGNIKEEGEYINNEMTGVWKFYYDQPNKALREEVTFKNNMENGPFKEYHLNGKLAAEGGYLDELEHGTTMVYNDKGKLVKKIKYDNGRPLEYETFD